MHEYRHIGRYWSLRGTVAQNLAIKGTKKVDYRWVSQFSRVLYYCNEIRSTYSHLSNKRGVLLIVFQEFATPPCKTSFLLVYWFLRFSTLFVFYQFRILLVYSNPLTIRGMRVRRGQNGSHIDVTRQKFVIRLFASYSCQAFPLGLRWI